MVTKNKKVTINYLQAKKVKGEKMTRVVLWDYPSACIADEAGVDMILVGDSLGMSILGYTNTIPVTMEDMIHHCKAVTRGTTRCLVVGDLPFMSYEVTKAEAVRNAGRLLKESGVDAIKLEGGSEVADKVSAIVKAGIPVHGHIGLTPQSVMQLGGFKTQGKSVEAAVKIYRDALSLQEAGCFAITLECVPPIIGKMISERISSLITIGVGAGPWCDGQSVNLHDLIGLTRKLSPKFAKRYATVGDTIKEAVVQYHNETMEGVFPTEEHCYNIEAELMDDIEEAIKKV